MDAPYLFFCAEGKVVIPGQHAEAVIGVVKTVMCDDARKESIRSLGGPILLDRR